MRKVIKKLTNYFTWAASSDLTPIDLPRDGLITEIRLRWKVVGAGTWVGARDHLEGFRPIVSSLEVKGDGGRSYFSMTAQESGRLLGLINCFDYQSPMVTYVAGDTEHITFVIHPGSNPKDPFDMSAVIPAQDLAQLQMSVSTGAATAEIDAANAIQTTSLGYITIYQVLGGAKPWHGMTPSSGTYVWPIDAAYSKLGKEIALPTGNWLRRMAILVQDEGTPPVRVDDQVTAIGIKLPQERVKLLDMHWEDFKQLAATWYKVPSVVDNQVTNVEYAIPAVPDGFGIIDFRAFAVKGKSHLYGIDARTFNPGDFKLGLTTATPTTGEDVIIWYDELIEE